MGQTNKRSSTKDTSKLNNQVIINSLNINFCLPKVVNFNQNHHLIFKSTFCQKQSHLKSIGQKLMTTRLIHTWLDDNVDTIFPILRGYFQSNLEPQ